MRRFFVDPLQLNDAKGIILGSEAHHIISVLRLEIGSSIQLFDGTGMIYDAVISSIAKGRVGVDILSSSKELLQSESTLHVGQALLKGKKMDLIVQKATELGIAGLYPFVSSYCINRSTASTMGDKRLERWRRISLEACKQSNRATPLLCHPIRDFKVFLSTTSSEGKYAMKLIFWEEEKKRTIKDVLANRKKSGPVMVLIGPEGGFSRDEVNDAVRVGYRPVTLGNKTLRAETASLTVMAILQHQLGNLG